MSGNAGSSDHKMDRRVQRTRDALGDALVALIREKPFDTITVQDVLDRANVGRSTFYQHFRDKEDLFISDADEFFEATAMQLSRSQDPSDRVALVREFFAHVGEMREFVAALVSSGRFRDVIELAQGHFARGIERRLAELARSRRVPAERRAAMAHAHAGAMLSLLQWWIDRGMRETPEQMDDLFHRMVWGVREEEESQ
ncbi:MAG: TetR/AcrR family transcriptional regulator [Blastocatellia bacterium]|nr:TetR/AcrR family transcriptional regulator [Blastocatellia bacterium]